MVFKADKFKKIFKVLLNILKENPLISALFLIGMLLIVTGIIIERGSEENNYNLFRSIYV